MAAMDACSARYKRRMVVPAAAGVAPRRNWAMEIEMRLPRYTTRFAELPVVRAT